MEESAANRRARRLHALGRQHLEQLAKSRILAPVAAAQRMQPNLAAGTRHAQEFTASREVKLEIE
jgi:hypothetical protein